MYRKIQYDYFEIEKINSFDKLKSFCECNNINIYQNEFGLTTTDFFIGCNTKYNFPNKNNLVSLKIEKDLNYDKCDLYKLHHNLYDNFIYIERKQII